MLFILAIVIKSSHHHCHHHQLPLLLLLIPLSLTSLYPAPFFFSMSEMHEKAYQRCSREGRQQSEGKLLLFLLSLSPTNHSRAEPVMFIYCESSNALWLSCCSQRESGLIMWLVPGKNRYNYTGFHEEKKIGLKKVQKNSKAPHFGRMLPPVSHQSISEKHTIFCSKVIVTTVFRWLTTFAVHKMRR